MSSQRRTFRPHRGEPEVEVSRGQEEETNGSWEHVRDEDLVVVPCQDEDLVVVPCQDEEEDEEEEECSIEEEEREEAVPVLLLGIDEFERQDFFVLDSDAAIQSLIESCWPRVRHFASKNDEERATVLGTEYVVVRFSEEIDGVSSRSLWQAARSSSRFKVVKDLKDLTSESTRSPRWKADMSAELDLLAQGCKLRAEKLHGLLLAKRAFEDRLATATFAEQEEAEVESVVARTNRAVSLQLTKRIRQVDDFAESLEDDRERGRDLLDAILAMILVRLHRPLEELASIQENCIQAWKDELGLFPRREDALLAASSRKETRPPPSLPTTMTT